MSNKSIIQITGQAHAGKSTLSRYLAREHGYTQITVSDLIRDYALSRGLELDGRAGYLDAHAQLSRELGEFAIVDSIMKVGADRICVDGMRVPAHAQELRARNHGSMILALHCPLEIRYERSFEATGHQDKQAPNFAAFREADVREFHSENPFEPSILDMMELADYFVDGSNKFTDVTAIVDVLLE